MPVQKSSDRPTAFKWDRLRILLALFRQGTLSAAARAIGVDHTTIARHLDGLEIELGAALFERSPEGFVPTPLGEEVIASAERIEDELFGLMRRVAGDPGRLSGTVRLTSTPFLTSQLFAPALGPFLQTNPQLLVELIGDNESLDVARREADVAIRFARPELPAMIARRIGSVAFACYAPAANLQPLEALAFLAYDETSVHLSLHKYIGSLVAPDRVTMRANMTQTLLEAVRGGLGCAILPCLIGESDPALRRVDVPYMMQPMPLWLAYHEDMRRSPRLRAVVEFVEAVVQSNREKLVPQGFPVAPA